jgi:hypothetical protein
VFGRAATTGDDAQDFSFCGLARIRRHADSTDKTPRRRLGVDQLGDKRIIRLTRAITLALVLVAATVHAASGEPTPRPGSTVTRADLAPWLASTDRVRVIHPPDAQAGALYLASGDATGIAVFDGPDDGYRAQRGFMRNGQETVLVPLASGGSGGVFATLVFTRVNGVRRYVGYIPSRSGHLAIRVQDGVLEARAPIYASSDPQCCPSRERYTTYTLDGIQLVTLSERTAATR